LVGAPFAEDAKTLTLDSVKYSQIVGFDEIYLIGAYPMEGSEGYQLWKNGKWSPLGVNCLNEIIILAKEIKANIDFSSNGLEKFWAREKGRLDSI